MQLQELAHDQMLETFSKALHHMSQDTLVTNVMKHLQLPAIPPHKQSTVAGDAPMSPHFRVSLPQQPAMQPQSSTLELLSSRKSNPGVKLPQPVAQQTESCPLVHLGSREPSLLDPTAMPHPKQRRSKRPTRPASAGVPGMHTRFSICARQSGYPAESSEEEEAEEADILADLQNWSKQLPASTSALLQAVEMAAAAERPGSTCPVTGKCVAMSNR